MELQIHFAKHGREFGLLPGQERDYEQMADALMFGVMAGNIGECIRPNNTDRLRIDRRNIYFGVASIVPQYVRTFYVPKPEKLARHGGQHGFFRFECGRITA